MLSSMQAFSQSYADVISRVTGIDVEIVDSGLTRIAGTGMYARNVGVNIFQAGEMYKEVMRRGETIIIESPRYHSICANCPTRETCHERFSLATPIINGDTILGVIGLVCFNDADRQRVQASLDSYTEFISFLADALAHKVAERDKLDRTRRFLDLMLQTVDVPGQGVMLFDYGGEMIFCNAAARELFALGADGCLKTGSIRRSGNGINEYEEFEVQNPAAAEAGPVTVLGRMVELDARSQDKVTLFVFELPARLAKLVGGISAGQAGTGFENIVGNSSALNKLRSKAVKVADSSSTVLIGGESGTGKELLARAIHQASSRRDHPFVAINCGGIPDTLLESELFGYVSGAFTGASNRGRMGKFELAQGGVIFLDEISTMPLYLQVKLLRVLQERSITRLGSNRSIHVDVRVIAASNENLQDCIRRNAFRDDLYYRLNVIPLTMPPLRDRRGDVGILAEYFLDKYCALFQKRKPRLRASVMRLLEGYAWPGNVRELEHVMEYAVNMMPENGPLTLDCLPAELLEHAPAREETPVVPLADTVASSGETGTTPLEILPLNVLEERAIRAALDAFGRSTEGKKKAAQALGLGLATLYRKMSAYSI